MSEEPQQQTSGLIWERLRSPVRTTQVGLSHERIVDAAISIADAEGIEGVSMRRIASHLGASPMALYRHVPGKDDLLDLMLDEVFGHIRLPERPSGDWRADLRALAHESRTTFKRHPWISTLLNNRPTLGPNYLRWFDYSLAAVAPLGVDLETMSMVVGTLYAYVRGVVSYELAEEENTRRTGLTDEAKRMEATPYVEGIIHSGQYPYFARFFTEGISPDPDRGFSFGLDCLLNGFAVCAQGTG